MNICFVQRYRHVSIIPTLLHQIQSLIIAIRYHKKRLMMQKQMRKCARESHPSKQHLQYICLQQFCFGKTRLVCNKCLKKYHFGHRFLPLRESMAIPLSQQQIVHQKKIQAVLANQLAAIPQLEQQVVNSVKIKIGTAISMLSQEVLKIKSMVSKEKLLKQAIFYLKYQTSQPFNDDQVNQKVDFIVRMSQQPFVQKMQQQKRIVNELGYKITRLKENITYFLSGFDEKLADIKAIIENQFQSQQTLPLKSKIKAQKFQENKNQMNQEKPVKKEKFTKKDQLRSKIKLKANKIKKEAVQKELQKQMVKRQSFPVAFSDNLVSKQETIPSIFSGNFISSQQVKQFTKSTFRPLGFQQMEQQKQVVEKAKQLKIEQLNLKRESDMIKKQLVQGVTMSENDAVDLFFNNPLQSQLDDHFLILQCQRKQNKNMHVRSFIIEFDGIRAFVPRFILLNVPPVLNKLKNLRINMYESCKSETFERIVKNFSDLHQLTITEVQSYSDQIIDLIVQKNPNLHKFYNFFNLRDNFESFVRSRHFKTPPYEAKLTIKQLTKLSELKYLQNIHIDQCHRQEAVQILQKMGNLKQVTLGTYITKRYIKKELLKALSKKKELVAVSFLNLILIFDECNSKQVFNWIKGPRQNLTTIYMYNFERITDKSIYLLSKQCNIEHLFLQKTPGVKGKSLGSLVALKSLIIQQSKIDAVSIKQSGFTELTQLQILELHVNIPSSFLQKFHKLKHLLIYYKETMKNLNDRNKQVFHSIDTNFFKSFPNLQSFVHNYWLKLEQFLLLLMQCPKLRRFCAQGLYYAQNQDSSQPISNFPMPLLMGVKPKSEQLQKLHCKQFSTIVPLLGNISHLAIGFTDPSNGIYVDKMNQVEMSKIIDKQMIETLKNINYMALNNLPNNLSSFQQVIVNNRLLLRIKCPLSEQKSNQLKESKLPIQINHMHLRRQPSI